MKRGFAWILAALLAGAVAPAGALWVTETVAATGDQGQWASVAIDAEGNVHAAWYDLSNGRLMYGVRGFTGWTVTPVEAGDVGEFASIAINPVTDLPAIAYHDGGNHEQRYAYLDTAWHTEQIVYEDDVEEGIWCDLVFRDDGTPFISYNYDNGALHTIGVNVVWKVGTAWDGHRVDYATWPAEMGVHTAIALDSAQYPQVAYRDNVLGYQKFGWQTGTGWNFETTVSLDIAGEWSDIALDSGDNVFISTFNFDTLGDDCASVFVKSLGEWHIENIECGGDGFGSYTGIAIDSADRAHVTYVGGDLRYAVRTGEDEYEIATAADAALSPQHTAIALDAGDHPHVVFYGAQAKDMMYARDLPAPSVISVSPDHGLNTGPVTGVEILGADFTPDSTVRLVRADGKAEIPGTNVAVSSPSLLHCDFDLTGAAVGPWDVEVENPAGTGSLPGGFRVDTLPPVLTSVDPGQGANDQDDFALGLAGNYFTPSMEVRLEAGDESLAANSVAVASFQSATATFDLTALPTQQYDVVVETEFGEATLAGAFEVVCGKPIAEFSADPLSGSAPLAVQFADLSEAPPSCDVTDWEWSFGDGAVSDDAAPSHTYTEPGTYNVTLTVTGPGGSDSETKNGYVNVTGPEDDDTGDDTDDDADDDTDDDLQEGSRRSKDDDGCGC